MVEKVIGNAEDGVEEEFVVESDRTFTINIAVTDNDWERPIDEDESNLGGDGPDDEEGKEGGREGGGDYEGKRVATGPSVRKVGFDWQILLMIHTYICSAYCPYVLTNILMHAYHIGYLQEKDS